MIFWMIVTAVGLVLAVIAEHGAVAWLGLIIMVIALICLIGGVKNPIRRRPKPVRVISPRDPRRPAALKPRTRRH